MTLPPRLVLLAACLLSSGCMTVTPSPRSPAERVGALAPAVVRVQPEPPAESTLREQLATVGPAKDEKKRKKKPEKHNVGGTPRARHTLRATKRPAPVRRAPAAPRSPVSRPRADAPAPALPGPAQGKVSGEVVCRWAKGMVDPATVRACRSQMG